MSRPKHEKIKLKYLTLEPIYKQAVEFLKIKQWEIAYAIGVSRVRVTSALNGKMLKEITANRIAEYISWREKGKPKAYYLTPEQYNYLKKSKKYKDVFIEEAEIFFNQN